MNVAEPITQNLDHDVAIVTNHHWRNLTYGHELAPKWRPEFDYLSDEDYATHDFLVYRGDVYDVCEFTVSSIPGWDGFRSDSYFSGIAIKYDQDYEQVRVALVMW